MTSIPTASSSATLKRTRPPATPTRNAASTDTAPVPQLPKITGDLLLQVYTHKSLRRPTSSTQEEYGTNERLSELGKTVLEVAMTYALFSQRPMLKATEIATQSADLLADTKIESWVKMYRMREKLRCHPDVQPALYSSEEARSLFNAYVAAVYTECGLETVQEWINRLLAHDRAIPPEPSLAVETPPQKKVKIEQKSPIVQPSPIFFASQPLPSPSRPAPPPPELPPPPSPNPLAPAQPSLAFLPLFNQTATQRRVTVEYLAEFSGPSHAGRWTIKCVVNGIPKGVGTGGSKQVAKEEAARKAFYAMGWT